MNPNVPLKSHKTYSSFRKAEAIFVLLFLCIGGWTELSFFWGAHNPNDMSFRGSPYAEGLSTNLLQLSSCLKNFSGVPLRSISLIGDAYDENRRIIGTGSLNPSTELSINPSDTLRFTIKIHVFTDCRNVRSIMLIPRSQLGTGKILVHTLPALSNE
ncbi:MAG: hypothetical protein Q8O92_08710 [Candidatus Latescibacter sp.]|nr:hypothetical protein [Candidatus Latescibacter sp.]